MKCKELDSKTLHSAFSSGRNQLLRMRDEINRINVFPVADGDTGTNLALTISNSHFGKCTCTFQNENASNS